MSREPAIPTEMIEELQDATKAVQLQEVLRRRGIGLRGREIISAAQCNGRMPTIGEPDDEIRLDSPADAHNLDPLSAERMMRMRDDDESRRLLE
jgi:hypothetical protein